jgi:hypothetical protein
MVMGQRFIAAGYGLEMRLVGGNRQATFAIRRAKGEQVIFSRFVVQRVAQPRPAATGPEPAPIAPDFDEAERIAAQSLISAAEQQSADVITFVPALLNRLSREPLSDEAAVLLGARPSDARKAQVAAGLLTLGGVTARPVHGVSLRTSQRHAKLAHWIEVYVDRAWRPFLLTGEETGLPEDYLPWWRGAQALAQVEGGSNLQVSISVERVPETALQAALAIGRAEDEALLALSLFNLPVETQRVYRVLFPIALGVLVLVILRNVIGFKTFGTFMPVLIALAFRETQLLWGVLLFSLVVALGLAVRFYLEHLKLLVVPRLAAVVIIVLLLMAMLSVLSHKLGLEQGLSVALFPMVILTMTIDRMSVVWDERGPSEAIQQGLGSLGAAVICYLLMSRQPVEHLLFVFPELLLVILAIVILLGRYSGYRLTELRRFAVLARKRAP